MTNQTKPVVGDAVQAKAMGANPKLYEGVLSAIVPSTRGEWAEVTVTEGDKTKTVKTRLSLVTKKAEA